MDMNDAVEMNKRWAGNWDSPEGREKNAALNNRWIRDHADEGSIFEKVHPATSVTPEQCDRSVNSKTPVMIEEVREGSWAMPVTFDGETNSEVQMGSRYMITFYKLQTAQHRYRLEELWTSRRPVIKHLEEDVAQAYVDAKDRVFIIYTEVAVWFTFQQDYSTFKLNLTNLAAGTVVESGVWKSTAAKLATNANGDPIDSWTIQALRKEDITILLRAFNTRSGEQLKAKTMLITEFDYVGVTDWDVSEVGYDDVAKSVRTVQGYNELKDIRICRTIKQRWLRPGNVYAWADWDFVGSHYRIGKVDTDQDKRGTEVTMFSYGVEGFGYGNVSAVKKLELFSASCNPESDATEDGTVLGLTVASVRPVGEENVIKNNQADAGNWIPTTTLQ